MAGDIGATLGGSGWTVGDIHAPGTDGSSSPSATVSDYAALSAALAAGTYQVGQAVYVEGPGAMAGWFKVIATGTDNGGTIIGGTPAAERVFSGPIDAAWFGLSESGTAAANAAAFQAAITASTGKKLLIPKGEYDYSVGVSTPANGVVHIIGDGDDPNENHGTILNFTGATGPAISITETSGSPATNKTTLQGFTLKGVVTNAGVVGVRINDAHRTRIRDMVITNFGSHGVHATDAWVTFIRDSTIAQNGQSGIHASGRCNNFVIKDCAVNANSRRNGYGNIYFTGGSGTENLGVSITGTDFTEAGPTTAIETITSAWGLVFQHTHGAIVHGCYSEKAVTSLIYGDSTAQSLDVRGNYFQDGQVYLANADNSVVESNTFTYVSQTTRLRVLSNAAGFVRVGVNSFNGGATELYEGQTGKQRVFYAASMPTSGSYVAGDIVVNKSPTETANGNVLLHWLRIVTGSSHVLGTDWLAIYGIATDVAH